MRNFTSLLIVLFFLLISTGSNGAEVSIDKARSVATNFYLYHSQSKNIESSWISDISSTYIKTDGARTLLYIFNMRNGGFVIVSGDDNTIPVLAYSLHNSFPVDNTPANIQSWLLEYTKQIQTTSDKNSFKDPLIKETWDILESGVPQTDYFKNRSNNVDPLVTANWHQGIPYNDACPEDPDGPNGHTLAGCIAIAMAQIMYYHRYPEIGYGQHSYYSNKYDTIKADFGNTTYRWNEMVDEIYHNPIPAVAELVFHCGVSINTSYSPTASGAFTLLCVDALINYFKYSQKAKYIFRADTTINYIDSLIYNLSQNKPVIYRGGAWGGHSFICDGFDNSGYFHFNFGWGGEADGYYNLDNLVPNGYNITAQQAAIINISPADPNFPTYCTGQQTFTATEGTFDDGSGYLNYQELSDCYYLVSPIDPDISQIMLIFESINTEEERDVITIYDGDSVTDPVLGSISGSHNEKVYISSENKLLIHFESDGENQDKGWFAKYIGYHSTFCKSYNQTTWMANWISDNSGPYNYANNSNCEWFISPNNPEVDSIAGIKIRFSEFSTYNSNDVLTIYNGPDTSYPILKSLSGSHSHDTLYASSNKIFLTFTTDHSSTASGWEFFYQPIFPEYCTDTTYLTEPHGTFGDGSGDKKYVNKSNCYWKISPPNAKEITLSFTEFDLEYGYDRVKVYDPTTSPWTLLGDFTSNTLPSPVTSSNGNLLVHFHSDKSNTAQGWTAEYSITNLGIKEPIIKEALVIHPIPARNTITISGNFIKGEHLLLKTFTSTGILVDSKEINDIDKKNKLDYNISNLKSGLYIIHIVNGNKVFHNKFIKTN